MPKGIALAVSAAVAAVFITVAMLFGAGWISETLMTHHWAHQSFIVRHARTIGLVVSQIMGMVGVFFALAAVWRHRNRAPEEPMKPRLRNGAI